MYQVGRVLFVLVLLCFSASAFAQTAVTCNGSGAASLPSVYAAHGAGVFNLAGTTGTPCIYTNAVQGYPFNAISNTTLNGGCAGQSVNTCKDATIIDCGGAAGVAGSGIIMYDSRPDDGGNGAINVIWDGVTFRNCGGNKSTAENGGPSIYTWNGWIIRNSHITLSGGWGIDVTGATVQNNLIDANSHGGVTPHQSYTGEGPTYVIGNEITNNNTRHDSQGNDAAGMKMSGAANFNKPVTPMYILNNYVHANFGDGIWCDVQSQNVIIQGNTVIGNNAEGIVSETCSNLDISGNVVNNNGLILSGISPPTGDPSQISIQAASGTNVYNNNVLVPAATGGQTPNGILIHPQARTDTAGGGGNSIHGNDITFAGAGGLHGWYQECAMPGTNCPLVSNHEDYNRFHLVTLSDTHFLWPQQSVTSGNLVPTSNGLSGIAWASHLVLDQAFSSTGGIDLHSTIDTTAANVAGCTIGAGCTGSGWPVATPPTLVSNSVPLPTTPTLMPGSCTTQPPLTLLMDNTGKWIRC